MSDRELLELAAKACGYEHYRYCEVHMALAPEAEGEDVLPFSVWNPLTDDGDALRLATKLRITVEQSLLETNASAYVLIGKERKHFCSVSGRISRDEATRQAIVRAAAEIGRSMP